MTLPYQLDTEAQPGPELQPGGAEWHRSMLAHLTAQDNATSAATTARPTPGGSPSRSSSRALSKVGSSRAVSRIRKGKALTSEDRKSQGGIYLAQQLASSGRGGQSFAADVPHGTPATPAGASVGNRTPDGLAGTLNRNRPVTTIGASRSAAQRPSTGAGGIKASRVLVQPTELRDSSDEAQRTDSGGEQVADRVIPFPPSARYMPTERPSTTSTAQESTSRALEGFWQFSEAIPEPPAPSDIQAEAVPLFIRADSNIDFENFDIAGLLTDRSNSEEMLTRSARRSLGHKNSLRSFSAITRSSSASGGRSLSARGPASHREMSTARHQSPGLLAHATLRELNNQPWHRQKGIDLSAPDHNRLAECCHLFDAMVVKYFDQEMEAIKEELFKCIFDDYQDLKKVHKPRDKKPFVDAKPFFELLAEEKVKTDALQSEVDDLSQQIDDLQMENAQLLANATRNPTPKMEKANSFISPKYLSFHAARGEPSPQRKSVAARDTSPMSARKRGSTATIDEDHHAPSMSVRPGSSRPPQVPKLFHQKDDLRPSTVESHRGRNGSSRHSSPPLDNSSRPPLLSQGSSSSIKGSSLMRQASMRTRRKVSISEISIQNTPRRHASLAPSKSFTDKKSPSLKSGSRRTTAASIKDGEPAQDSDEDADPAAQPKNPFLIAAGKVDSVVSKLSDFEDFLGIYRQVESAATAEDGKQIVMTKVFGKTMRRRKADKEARWKDFAVHLSRYPAKQVSSKAGLKDVYGEWRAAMNLQADFNTMFRALMRHRQVEDLGLGDTDLKYSETIGVELDPSSDEEEDMEELIIKRDQRIHQLTLELQKAEEINIEARESHGKELTRQVEGLEQHHQKLYDAEVRRKDEEIEELMTKIKEKEAELTEAQRALAKRKQLEGASGPEAVAALKEQVEEAKAGEKRAQGVHKQLQADFAKVQDTVAGLKSKLDHAKAAEAEAMRELTTKLEFAKERALREQQKKHDDAISQLLEDHHKKIEDVKEALRYPVKISEKRFVQFIDTFRELEMQLMDVLSPIGDEKLGEHSIYDHVKSRFAATTKEVYQLSRIEGIYDSDPDEEYNNPEIGDFREHGTNTAIVPETLGLTAIVQKGKKGKKGKAKKEKKSAAPKAEPLKPVPKEDLDELHRIIENVYGEMLRFDTISVLGGKEGMAKFYARSLIGKYHEVPPAEKEQEKHKVLIERLRGVDPKITIFGRLTGHYDSLPQGFADFLLDLKKLSYIPPEKDLKWADSIIEQGTLPPGTQGDRPNSDGGIVIAETALKWVKYICSVYELRHHKVLERMERKLMYDSAKEKEVYGLEDLMMAIAEQVDAKCAYLEEQCNLYMTPSTPLTVDTILLPLRALAPQITDPQVVSVFMKTYEEEKAGRMLAQAFSGALLEHMPLLNPHVRLETEEVEDNTFLTSVKA